MLKVNNHVMQLISVYPIAFHHFILKLKFMFQNREKTFSDHKKIVS